MDTATPREHGDEFFHQQRTEDESYVNNIEYSSISSFISNFVATSSSLLRSVPDFFAEFGWPLLFTALILFFVWPYVEKMRQTVSLSVANNPVRKETFDTELKRARAMQQLDVYKANRMRDAESGRTCNRQEGEGESI